MSETLVQAMERFAYGAPWDPDSKQAYLFSDLIDRAREQEAQLRRAQAAQKNLERELLDPP